MKTTYKLIIFAGLLLPVISNAKTAEISHSFLMDSSLQLLIAFLILDVLLGFFLIFGKFLRIKKKESDYRYLRSHRP